MELAPTTTTDTAPVPVHGPVEVDVRAAIIDELLTARAQVHAGEVKQVWMALQWALAHPAVVGADGVITDYAGWGEPRLSMPGPLVPLAGPGAPLVHPLAPLELAAALDRSVDHAMHLLADALELAFRLSRLWALVQEERVPVWVARQISRETRDLAYDAAAHADRLITAVPDKIARVDARRLVHEARLTADPDRAVADEEEAMSRRGVWLRRDRRAPGVIDVNMTLDADDADLLDATVSRVAADLRDLGDTSSRDIRRATAVGILADPQHALDLMSGRTTDVQPGGQAGSGGDTDLVVHLTPVDLDDTTSEQGTFVEETRGPVSALQRAAWIRRRATHDGRVRVRAVLHGQGHQGHRGHRGPRDGRCATSSTTGDDATTDLTSEVRAWLARHGIDAPVTTLTPIHLSNDTAVDAHDPPPLMREQVAQRDGHCVFPGCRRDSRTCDLDHTEAYLPPDDGGPPGQTNASNLAPLCRRHHNAKTHHGWTYRRRPDGAYTWTSPTHHGYVVVPNTRAPLNL
ncbi:HNH endonuclease signature motif containing protein [Nocardioides marmoraquaticus]